MNTTITFPLPQPALKISSPSAEKWEFALREERRRLSEDQEALREREHNLRNYEARLRSLQDEIAAGRVISASPFLGSHPPFPTRPATRGPRPDDAALPAAWDKLHRARELLEAEQDHVRIDRNVLREQEISLRRREEAVADREAQVAEREARLRTEDSLRPSATHAADSAAVRPTRMPFGMAWSMLGGKKHD